MRLSPLTDAMQRSFWLLPALAIAVAIVLGLGIPAIDYALDLRLPILASMTVDTVTSLLQTIATAAAGVAGVAFSVVVVAFQLASQQLSPRALRTFLSDRLNQAALALLVGSFVYSLLVLVLLQAQDPSQVPQLAVLAAVIGALATFAVFVVFIHNVVTSLQAATLIRRMASDGQKTIEHRYPAGIGKDPDDERAARRHVEAFMGAAAPVDVRAPRAGFVVEIDGCIVSAARDAALLVVQRAGLGEFVLTGGVLATAWTRSRPPTEKTIDQIGGMFKLDDERTIVQDVSFPVRQLADVALRAISPSLNDPTTAENAMNSLADTLGRFARCPSTPRVRVDDGGEARFVAAAPTLNDLVRLGFDQVRVKAAPYPVLAAQLVRLLAAVESIAAEAGVDCSEAARQASLLREGVGGEVPTDADIGTVQSAVDDSSSGPGP